MDREEIQRGERFADEVYALVHRLAPSGLDAFERDVLGAHLISAAVSWVQSRNRTVTAQVEGR